MTQHVLVPKHEKISEEEKQTLFDKYNITVKELPKINISDAAIKDMETKPGDVIRITRRSPTAGVSIYYRGVTNE